MAVTRPSGSAGAMVPVLRITSTFTNVSLLSKVWLLRGQDFVVGPPERTPLILLNRPNKRHPQQPSRKQHAEEVAP